jgi:hypothetical protein
VADEPDYGFLWAWEPVRPPELPGLLAGVAAPWWVAGGWALDLFLGRETRTHEDLDIALLRRDQLALHRHLRGWDLRYATPEHTLQPWDASYLELPIHGIWARRSARATAPWTCEFLLNEERDGHWIYRRNETVTRPIKEIGACETECHSCVRRLLSSISRRTIRRRTLRLRRRLAEPRCGRTELAR